MAKPFGGNAKRLYKAVSIANQSVPSKTLNDAAVQSFVILLKLKPFLCTQFDGH